LAVRTHLDSEIFLVEVLWLVGLSAAEIARRTGKRRNQVLNIVARRYGNRAAMTIAERQAILDDLRARPSDLPRLPDRFFVALPLMAGQVRPARSAETRRASESSETRCSRPAWSSRQRRSIRPSHARRAKVHASPACTGAANLRLQGADSISINCGCVANGRPRTLHFFHLIDLATFLPSSFSAASLAI
jgi:hypothetical protein